MFPHVFPIPLDLLILISYEKVPRVTFPAPGFIGRAFVTDFNKLTPGAKTSVDQGKFEEYVRLLGKHWTNRWTIASHRKLLQSRFQTRRRREQFMDKLTNNLLVPITSNLALGLETALQ